METKRIRLLILSFSYTQVVHVFEICYTINENDITSTSSGNGTGTLKD